MPDHDAAMLPPSLPVIARRAPARRGNPEPCFGCIHSLYRAVAGLLAMTGREVAQDVPSRLAARNRSAGGAFLTHVTGPASLRRLILRVAAPESSMER
jgi:hypothetical protein